MLVAVACYYKDVIISKPKPSRHHDILRSIGHLIDDHSQIIQGFLTSDGKFLNRMEAKSLVKQYDLPTIGDHNSTELFSEDLW